MRTHEYLLSKYVAGLLLRNLENNALLIHVRLSNCGIQAVTSLTLPNLQHLDLSANDLQQVNMADFRFLYNLRVLNLASNPLTSLVLNIAASASGAIANKVMVLEKLDLSFTKLTVRKRWEMRVVRAKSESSCN
jgi:Leucine-rich repeat (LRR) protein